MTERRVKLVYVDPDDVLNAILSVNHDNQALSIRKIKGLPDGSKVESVFFSHELRAFGFIVEHPSFPPISSGARPEIIAGVHCLEPCEVLLLDEPNRRRLNELEVKAMPKPPPITLLASE